MEKSPKETKEYFSNYFEKMIEEITNAFAKILGEK